MSERARALAEKLRERVDAVHVDVADESHLHTGHPGAVGGGGHFRALVVSPRFEGLSRVAAQRVVYRALAAEMQGEIHALALTTLTPEDWRAQGGR